MLNLAVRSVSYFQLGGPLFSLGKSPDKPLYMRHPHANTETMFGVAVSLHLALMYFSVVLLSA